MARIAVITFAGGGNIPPLVRIATELSARGHDLHVLADAATAAQFDAPSTELTELGFWTPGVARSVAQTTAQAVRLVSDRALEESVLRQLAVLRPDVVLVDCLLAGCARGAREAGFRAVVLFHTYLDYWTKNLARGPVGMLAALRGRGPRRSWDAADLRLVLCDAELDPSAPADGTVWTGSTERGTAATAQHPPLVVASLSTMELPGQADAYREIVRALGSLDVQGIVTLGGLDVEALVAPPNVEIRGRVPHDDLFPHASLVIGHGGLSTTSRALAHGVPLVLMPMHPLLDQPMVARSVADAGAGVLLKRTATADDIAASAGRVLADQTYRAAAMRIGDRFRSVDGAGVAADAVERVILERRLPTAPR
ncbi:glycosyltransferase [Microbacterium sp. ASV49]|uniref:Glycosyltransferase n=1 Tax=Microbacterium candidum TaxID=3041922 RepID=A0ABT7N342_9MICO|nr:glycosyltransferase [Microbacterium sp. ASV49]MDL9981127.1 glycosyltransferase [Microbacterium sp. ASV49]